MKSSLVTQGRNLCVSGFLESNYTHMLFIDSDIYFEATSIIKMIEKDKDIISIPYPLKTMMWDKAIDNIKDNKTKIDDQEISEVLTVNGIRFSFKDGSWGLIRASSNKPSLVIVTESPTSNERKKKIFDFIDDLLQKTGKVGEYDQKI